MPPQDLSAISADFYTANAHKWLCAPKGAALLHANAAGREHLQPTVISHSFPDVVAGFDFLGTRDYTPWLSLPATLAFRDELGDEAVMRHNHALALQARSLLLEAFGTPASGPESMVGSLSCLRVPDGRGEATWEGAAALNNRLWSQHRIEVPFFPFNGGLWMRVSAQVYNHLDEYRRLIAVL